MTGKFSEKDPERCHHYARFMSHLTLAEANTVFWLLFVIVRTVPRLKSLIRIQPDLQDAIKRRSQR